NCAAISPTLVEAELFGACKGSYTGATEDRPGVFQQADDGTLFLDEIGELSLDCQAKLLRVIEGKGFRPVGATAEVYTDGRVVAATHRDLEEEVRKGKFRQDLFFRLRVLYIEVPPLRAHAEDIPELVAHFLPRLAGEGGRQLRLSEAALQRLQQYSWPGNVRQLRAVLESAVAMSDGEVIEADDLPLPNAAAPCSLPPNLNLADVEAWAVRQVIQQTGGNVSRAAKVL